MERYFNITGCCNPQEHYMVNLDSRLAQIKKMVDRGQYFCINRGRQYGKTTLLDALQSYLQNDYTVISMDFQAQMSAATFENERTFSKAFIDAFIETAMFSDETTLMEIAKNELTAITNLVELFRKLSVVCKLNDKKIVLMIDEVDSASNNQVFLDFLAQLRGYYLIRNKRPTFQSVIRPCEKISVNSTTVIKNDIASGLKNSRSNFLQYTITTVICQVSSAVSLLERSETEWEQTDCVGSVQSVGVHDLQLAKNSAPVPQRHCPLLCNLVSCQIQSL